MARKDKLIIVLVRLVEDARVKELRRSDLGERPILETFKRAMSCCWLRAGTLNDLRNASEYGEKEGYSVYSFPQGTKNAIKLAEELELGNQS